MSRTDYYFTGPRVESTPTPRQVAFAQRRAQMQPLARTGDNLDPLGREFPWGPIQTVHTINDITIVEYLRDNSRLGNPSEDSLAQHGTPAFHVYVDGASTSTSYRSLDSALVGAIAHRRCGPNSQAARHFDLITLGALPPQQ